MIALKALITRTLISRSLMTSILVASMLISNLIAAELNNLPSTQQLHSDSIVVEDHSRQRLIPVELYYPAAEYNCKDNRQCPVMILSSGYGLLHTEYQFISQHFQQQGYLVIAVRHELPSDPPLSRVQPFAQTRAENWQRGADTLNFIQYYFSEQYVNQLHTPDVYPYSSSNFDFEHITLIGHSNGGDISVLLATNGATTLYVNDLDTNALEIKNPDEKAVAVTNGKSESSDASQFEESQVDYISRIITLDHRRVPLPRDKAIDVLSIRASDYPADEGVLPTEAEDATNIAVVKIEDSRHNDMNDYGPMWLKDRILSIIDEHMQF